MDRIVLGGWWPRFRGSLSLALVMFLSSGAAVADKAAPDPRPGKTWVTWVGSEPDKGAAAWFIRRHVDPQARFLTAPVGATLAAGLAFDVPTARWRRTARATTFEMLLQDYPTADPVVTTLAHLLHDLEINLWRPKQFSESRELEIATRQLAARYADGNVPLDCFVLFFDTVYTWVQMRHARNRAIELPETCVGTQLIRGD